MWIVDWIADGGSSDRSAATRRKERAQGLGQRFRGAREDCDVSAIPREPQRDRTAEPATSAADDRRLAGEWPRARHSSVSNAERRNGLVGSPPCSFAT